MKKIVFVLSAIIMSMGYYFINAADHIDAPAVGSLASGSSLSDITDYYAFESPSNADNYVFVCNVSGLTAPGDDKSFSSNIMYEFNIDNDGDNMEDLVIQAVFRDGQVHVFGPTAPSQTGLVSKIETGGPTASAAITALGESAVVGEAAGMKVFAGQRDDPFFMDFFKFVDIVNGAGKALGLEVADPANGESYATSFDAPGADTFAGSNVLSVVVEVPKSSLGSSNTFTSWVESKTK